jgi:hypothetical protein
MKNERRYFVGHCFLIVHLLMINSNSAQPVIQWQKCLGGIRTEEASSIIQAFDGGYIVTGNTLSSDGDVTGNHDTSGVTSDIWIAKLNSLGSLLWQHCLGGSLDDIGYTIIQTNDSGFAICGLASSNDGDIIGNHGGQDLLIIKFDRFGNIEWKKIYGGSMDDAAYSIREIDNDGYLLVGKTYSNDGNVSGLHDTSVSTCDAWVLKLNGIGNIDWQKCLGGLRNDFGLDGQKSNGGYIINGWTFSNDGNVSGNNGGAGDAWVVKLDLQGNFLWQKCLGGSASDAGNKFVQSSDSGYVFMDWTYSNDSNVSGNHGSRDIWIVKTDSSGDIVWQKCLGGTNFDVGSYIDATNDGGFVIAGATKSNDGDVSGLHLFTPQVNDFWIVKFDSIGTIEWQKCLGSIYEEFANSIHQTSDSGFILAGITYCLNNDGDVSGAHGSGDYWVVKLIPAPVGVEEISNNPCGVSLFPNPSTNQIILESKKSPIINIEIFNLVGELIYSKNESIKSMKKTIGISQLPSGLYFVKIQTEKGKANLKFIKE